MIGVHSKHIWNICILAALIALLSLSINPARPGLAYNRHALPQASSGMDLVNAVNALRAQYGLEPYTVDGSLMSIAQGQSDYQASIGDCTHNRADGSSFTASGVSSENIACGQGISAEDAVNSQWTDQLHRSTMIGPDSGQVGAGATSVNGFIYYTLDVRRGSGSFTDRSASSSNTTTTNNATTGQAAPTSPPVSDSTSGNFATSTPNSDGSITHILKYGETLIEIANEYGITLNDLISMNGLDAQKPVYFAGQVLIIRTAFTATPFITSTITPRPPTRTPGPTRTPRPTRTATAPQTPLPTWTATPKPLIQIPSLDDLGSSRRVMAYGFITVGVIGLAALAFFSFRPGKKG